MRALPPLAAVAAALLLVPAARADVAFPARLDVVETAPGRFDVGFTLPIVEGRKLRALPRLPPTCSDVSSREVSVSPAGHNLSWTVECDPASLAGEAILVEGLLGTQTELAFALTTLDGRAYKEILRPSRPGFLVPEPPSVAGLAAEAAPAGMRRALRQLPLWLLLMTATLLGTRWRELARAAGACAVAHAFGQWLGGGGWLGVVPAERDLFVLATVAVPAIALAGGGERWHGWVRPLWPAAILIGLLYGGATPETLPPDGLAHVEQGLALAFFAVGVVLGLMMIAAAAIELEAVLRLAGGGRWRERGGRLLGYAIGGLATGMLLARLASLALLPADGRQTPLELVLAAALLGPSLALAGRAASGAVPAFAGLAGVGVAAGLTGVAAPLGSTLVLGSLLLLGVALAVPRLIPGRWLVALAVVAVPAHTWFATQALVENVSRSTAAAFGVALVGTCVFFVARASSIAIRGSAVPIPLRLLGVAAAVLSALARLGEYGNWFDRELATEAVLGLVRLPVLAALLVIAAVFTWPRRRRVLDELGVARRPRVAHWLLIGAAWLALPYGTLAVRNPVFEPRAPRGEEARRVAASVLSDTYHAFNIDDEDALYDSLSESVTGDLIDDLYLDSRRRLTAGTLQGAQVTVRDVSVLEIGDPVGEGAGLDGLAYDCRWVVVARVQHLQHVHHRRNVYNGVLTLRIDGERWKIAGVDLRSEEREVVPWNPA